MWKMRIKFMLSLIVLFFLSGCSKTDFFINIRTDSEKIIVDHNSDISLATYIENITPGAKVASERFIKRDLLFIVWHELEITIFSGLQKGGDLPTEFPLEITVTFPGEIIKTNATEISGNKAIWDFKPGDEFLVSLKTRYVRWWLIILLVLFISWWVLRLRKQV